MSMMLTLLLAVQVLSALSIIILVMLQQGKGSEMGAAFGAGSGSAGSLFGSAGAANFLSRSTKWAAIIFFCATGTLAYFSQGAGSAPPEIGIMEGYEAVDPSIPQAPDEVDGAVPTVPDSGVPSVPGNDAAVPSAVEVPAPAADVPVAPAPAMTEPEADAVPSGQNGLAP